MGRNKVQTVKSALVPQVWLSCSLLAAWLALSLPVGLMVGPGSLFWLTLAGVVCFVPGSLVLAMQPMWVTAGAAGFGAMAGAGLRMVFVVCALVAVAVRRPDVPLGVFGLELSAFYLVALWVETLLVVRGLKRAAVPSA